MLDGFDSNIVLYTVSHVCWLYGIKANRKLIEEVELVARQIWIQEKKTKEIPAPEFKLKQENALLKNTLSGYLYDRNSSQIEPVGFINTYCKDKKLAKKLIRETKNEESVFRKFLDSEHLLVTLIDFLSDSGTFSYSNEYELMDAVFTYSSQPKKAAGIFNYYCLIWQ